MKQKILILLALCLALPVCAGCDGDDDPGVGHESSSDSHTEETTEAVTEADSAEAVPELDIGLLTETLDFADLAQSTVGKDYVAAVYDSFLASVAQNPEQVLHDGESGNYFRVLMSDAKEKRHNVMLEITNAEQKKWTYLLISTEDDFTLVVQDTKKKKTFTVGFTDGGFVDQLHYTDKSDSELLTKMIAERGYESVLNQVRDEFFGRLSKLTVGSDEGYKLGFTGKIHNMWSEDKTLNPAEARDYTMSEIQLVNAEDISKVFTAMEATYDIPNDYPDTLLGSDENKDDMEKEAG